MNRLMQQSALKAKRLELIEKLEDLYKQTFGKLREEELGQIGIAKLTQLILQSKDGAITPLTKEIEKSVITKAPS